MITRELFAYVCDDGRQPLPIDNNNSVSSYKDQGEKRREVAFGRVEDVRSTNVVDEKTTLTHPPRF